MIALPSHALVAFALIILLLRQEYSQNVTPSNHMVQTLSASSAGTVTKYTKQNWGGSEKRRATYNSQHTTPQAVKKYFYLLSIYIPRRIVQLILRLSQLAAQAAEPAYHLCGVGGAK